jgi:hypothetical protein
MSEPEPRVRELLGEEATLAASCHWVDDHGRPLQPAPDSPATRLSAPHYVYAVERAGAPFGRVRGRSRVLYVGRGTPRSVLGLTAGTHPALPALYRAGRALEVERVDLWVKPCASDALAAAEQVRALHRLARSHGELPPGNRRWPGSVLGEYLRLLTRLAGHRGRTRVYDWPRRRPRATWADVHEKGQWVWSLAWVWTDAWLEHGAAEPPHAGELLLVLPKGRGVAEHRSHRALRQDVLEASRSARVAHAVDLRPLEEIEEAEGAERLFDALTRVEPAARRGVESQRAVIAAVARALAAPDADAR